MKYLEFIRKIFLIFSFLILMPQISQAAITDCSQLSSDGQRDCIAPTVTYTGSFGGRYSSLDEIIQAYKEIQCNTLPGFSQCTLKTTTSYKTPSTCTQTNNCNLYTRVLGAPGNYAQVVVEKFKDSAQTWSIDSRGLVNKIDYCPLGYTKVTVNSNQQTSLCKPPQSTRSVFCEDCVNSQLGQSQIANPVNLNSGIMSHIEHDYQGHGLYLNRYYNSVSNDWFFSYSRKINYISTLINNVNTEFLTLTRDNGIAFVYKKNPMTSIWENITPNSNGIIYDLNSGNNNLSFYKYLNENNELESYDTSGRLIEIKSLQGQKINLSYTSDNSGTSPALYTKISDDFNHTIQYKTLPSSNCSVVIVNAKILEKINGIDVEKLNYDYGYNTSCKNNLITYPNLLTNSYTYTSNNRLSSIIDENNQVKFKWSYVFNTARSQYVVLSTGLTSTGNINKNTMTYNTNLNLTKTNAFNQITGIVQQNNNGALSTTDYSTGYCSDCMGFQGKNTQYDSRGNIISYQDFNNNTYQMSYDNQSRLLQNKSAVGTSIENIINYSWHLNTRLPEIVQIPVTGGFKTYTFIYDDVYETINNQNILVKSQLKQVNISAPDNANLINPNNISAIITKITKYYYNNLNQLIKIENPRFVQSNGLINDVILFNYENNELKSLTNGLNQSNQYSNYNAYGQPGLMVKPNGTQYIINYDVMGRVSSYTFVGYNNTNPNQQETTLLDYENTGLVKKVTYPTGNYIKLIYDLAYRLTTIEQYDSNNNYLGKTDFILDNMSNLTNVNIYNWQNVNGVMTNQLIQTSSAQYDAKNRLYKTIGAYNQTNQLTYDNNNNMTQIQDPANYLTNSNYDQLNRLTQITQADSGIVQFNYTIDNLTASVKDPKNLETIYTYDGFGRLIQLNSPDTGISTMTYDIGDNLIISIDANLNQVNYTYDDINRIKNINYPQKTSLNAILLYDNCLNGVGQLCSIQDNSGIKSYTYNDKARIQSSTYQYNFNTISNKVINYSYTNKGQLESMTYPSGKVLQYSYNNNNQLNQINVNNFRVYNSNTQQVDLVNKNILNNVQYQAFNDSPLSFDFSNNSTYSQNFNLDGEIDQINYHIIDNINLNIQNDYVFDSRDNMIAINQTENQVLNPNLSSSQSYDSMSRILSQNFGVANQSDYQINHYTYDNSSDRLSRNTTDNTSIKNNIYEYLIVNNQESHKISKIKDHNNLLVEDFTYDNNGNTIENNQYQINNSVSILAKKNIFTYDRNNRLTQVNIQDFINPNNQTVFYDINSSGQRIRKTKNSQSTIFIYDENSQLIAEYDQNDQLIKEYIDFSGVPVAFIQPKIMNNFVVDEMFYIYSDNLGTPRKISDQNNVSQWSWNQTEPFGDSQPISNNLQFNLRFPGQYHDSETNTNYNIFRDYNPHIGRYSQSDPIGLQGGLNSFAYSNNNPVKYFDENGLIPSLNQSFVDFFSGYGDSASFGLTYLIRNLGGFNEVNMCSSAYYIGEASEVIVNLASYGTSVYLRSLIRKLSKQDKKDIREAASKELIYQIMMKKGSQVHHINPLNGHKNLKGIKSKLEATFPTGGLNIKIHTSKWNLKTLTTIEHNKAHARAIILENNYELYHSPITTGLKIETNTLNR